MALMELVLLFATLLAQEPETTVNHRVHNREAVIEPLYEFFLAIMLGWILLIVLYKMRCFSGQALYPDFCLRGALLMVHLHRISNLKHLACIQGILE